MDIYSVAWGWTPVPEDMPEGDSLLRIADQVKSLGFAGIDYLSTYESLDAYFTPEKCRSIQDYCQHIGLKIGGLVFQSDRWNHPDQAVQERQQAYFRKCAEAAVNLGASAISCIIPRPFGARGTRPQASPAEKRSCKLPADYNWQADWNLFVRSIRQAALLTGERGLNLALECFPGSLCSTPHAMLQVIDEVNLDHFGIQLDTAHLINQAIDIETAIFMLGKDKIKHMHFKDSDGLTRTNLPAGCGLVDYPAVLQALKHIGYEGHASIEVEFTDNPRRYMKQAFDHIDLCLKGLY